MKTMDSMELLKNAPVGEREKSAKVFGFVAWSILFAPSLLPKVPLSSSGVPGPSGGPRSTIGGVPELGCVGGKNAANVTYKIIDVLQDPGEEVITAPQPLEEIDHFLGKCTLSRLLLEIGNQLDLLLKLKLRLAVDPRSQTTQIGEWNWWRIRQWIGEPCRLRQAPESPLQTPESVHASQAVVAEF
jgi:hypothetical protein